MTNRRARGAGPAGREHAARPALGRRDRSGSTEDYVWVFLISGAAPPAHHIGGYAGHGLGASLRCTSAWRRHGHGASPSPARSSGAGSSSRAARLKLDIGRAEVVRAAARRDRAPLELTTPQWPIMHAVLHGVTPRPDDGPAQGQPHPGRLRRRRREADLALYAKAALASELGLEVSLCGTRSAAAAL